LSALTNALASLTAATEIAVFLEDSALSLPKDEMKLKGTSKNLLFLYFSFFAGR
jgi:hypothetical protein